MKFPFHSFVDSSREKKTGIGQTYFARYIFFLLNCASTIFYFWNLTLELRFVYSKRTSGFDMAPPATGVTPTVSGLYLTA